MSRRRIKLHYNKTANWLLVIYLIIMISGCSFRPAELTPEAARIMQTREFNRSPEEVARAVVVLLQELHYSLGNVDMGLGIITAERTSERRLAPISRESAGEAGISDDIKTLFIIAGAIAITGFFLAWIFNDNDDSDENMDQQQEHNFWHRGYHHDPDPVYISSNVSNPSIFKYSITVNLEEISSQQTRIRISVQGQRLEGLEVLESGPVQSNEFYTNFYNRLQSLLY